MIVKMRKYIRTEKPSKACYIYQPKQDQIQHNRSIYISNPKKGNVKDVKRLFRYIKDTINQGIQYSEGNNNNIIDIG